jgi:hypothetical protein
MQFSALHLCFSNLGERKPARKNKEIDELFFLKRQKWLSSG